MFKVSSFYKFFAIPKTELQKRQLEVRAKGKNLTITGLALISKEGLNATFCGSEKSIEILKKELSQLFNQSFFWKDTNSPIPAFKRLSVKIKKDIINIGKPCSAPAKKKASLSPEEWEEKLKNKAQILDVRNTYEVELGRFQGAIDLNIDHFQQFSKKLDQFKLSKEKETLIYCTGGIRCEKALKVMKDKGFQKVYQLKGGILNYLKEFPNSYFEKECFVFDHRVSLNQNLEMVGTYSLCPHCGQPGNQATSCKHCEKPCVICKTCQKKSVHYETCSKNCAYHFKQGHICRKKYKATPISKNTLNPV